MKKSIGAIILAAGTSEISKREIIKKEISQLRKVGVGSIVVVTGFDGDEIERDLARRKVTHVRNLKGESSQMLDSVKLGIEAIGKEYNQLIILPADIPSVKEKTLKELITYEALIVVPSHKGKSGHPIVIDQKVSPSILGYMGSGGLRAVIEQIGFETVEVDDQGILWEVETEGAYKDLLKYETLQLMAVPIKPEVSISLAREFPFFGMETVEFLIAVDWLGSMNKACRENKIAYSRAWTMINEAEAQIGYTLITRKTGGEGGGESSLTQGGKDLVSNYLELKAQIEKAAEKAYNKIFGKEELSSLLE